MTTSVELLTLDQPPQRPAIQRMGRQVSTTSTTETKPKQTAPEKISTRLRSF